MKLMLAFLLTLAATSAFAQTNPPPLTAKIRLQNKKIWEVEIKGRHRDLVSMVETGHTIEVGIAPKEIQSIQFHLDLDKTRALDQYYANDFIGVVATLQPLLTPTFPYLDITNNVAPYVSLLLKSSYWAGHYPETLKLADTILPRLSDATQKRETQMFRALALLETGQKTIAQKALDQLGTVERTDSLAAMYFYAQACLQFAGQQSEPAHITATKLVVFRAKDHEWMPAGLYLTARGYGKGRNYETATQVTDELKRFYPKSRWIALIPEMEQEFRQQREADEKEKAEKEKAEAAKAFQPIGKEKP